MVAKCGSVETTKLGLEIAHPPKNLALFGVRDENRDPSAVARFSP